MDDSYDLFLESLWEQLLSWHPTLNDNADEKVHIVQKLQEQLIKGQAVVLVKSLEVECDELCNSCEGKINEIKLILERANAKRPVMEETFFTDSECQDKAIKVEDFEDTDSSDNERLSVVAQKCRKKCTSEDVVQLPMALRRTSRKRKISSNFKYVDNSPRVSTNRNPQKRRTKREIIYCCEEDAVCRRESIHSVHIEIPRLFLQGQMHHLFLGNKLSEETFSDMAKEAKQRAESKHTNYSTPLTKQKQNRRTTTSSVCTSSVANCEQMTDDDLAFSQLVRDIIPGDGSGDEETWKAAKALECINNNILDNLDSHFQQSVQEVPVCCKPTSSKRGRKPSKPKKEPTKRGRKPKNKEATLVEPPTKSNLAQYVENFSNNFAVSGSTTPAASSTMSQPLVSSTTHNFEFVDQQEPGTVMCYIEGDWANGGTCQLITTKSLSFNETQMQMENIGEHNTLPFQENTLARNLGVPASVPFSCIDFSNLTQTRPLMQTSELQNTFAQQPIINILIPPLPASTTIRSNADDCSAKLLSPLPAHIISNCVLDLSVKSKYVDTRNTSIDMVNIDRNNLNVPMQYSDEFDSCHRNCVDATPLDLSGKARITIPNSASTSDTPKLDTTAALTECATYDFENNQYYDFARCLEELEFDECGKIYKGKDMPLLDTINEKEDVQMKDTSKSVSIDSNYVTMNEDDSELHSCLLGQEYHFANPSTKEIFDNLLDIGTLESDTRNTHNSSSCVSGAAAFNCNDVERSTIIKGAEILTVIRNDGQDNTSGQGHSYDSQNRLETDENPTVPLIIEKIRDDNLNADVTVDKTHNDSQKQNSESINDKESSHTPNSVNHISKFIESSEQKCECNPNSYEHLENICVIRHEFEHTSTVSSSIANEISEGQICFVEKVKSGFNEAQTSPHKDVGETPADKVPKLEQFPANLLNDKIKSLCKETETGIIATNSDEGQEYNLNSCENRHIHPDNFTVSSSIADEIREGKICFVEKDEAGLNEAQNSSKDKNHHGTIEGSPAEFASKLEQITDNLLLKDVSNDVKMDENIYTDSNKLNEKSSDLTSCNSLKMQTPESCLSPDKSYDLYKNVIAESYTDSDTKFDGTISNNENSETKVNVNSDVVLSNLNNSPSSDPPPAKIVFSVKRVDLSDETHCLDYTFVNCESMRRRLSLEEESFLIQRHMVETQRTKKSAEDTPKKSDLKKISYSRDNASLESETSRNIRCDDENSTNSHSTESLNDTNKPKNCSEIDPSSTSVACAVSQQSARKDQDNITILSSQLQSSKKTDAISCKHNESEGDINNSPNSSVQIPKNMSLDLPNMSLLEMEIKLEEDNLDFEEDFCDTLSLATSSFGCSPNDNRFMDSLVYESESCTNDHDDLTPAPSIASNAMNNASVSKSAAECSLEELKHFKIPKLKSSSFDNKQEGTTKLTIKCKDIADINHFTLQPSVRLERLVFDNEGNVIAPKKESEDKVPALNTEITKSFTQFEKITRTIKNEKTCSNTTTTTITSIANGNQQKQQSVKCIFNNNSPVIIQQQAPSASSRENNCGTTSSFIDSLKNIFGISCLPFLVDHCPKLPTNCNYSHAFNDTATVFNNLNSLSPVHLSQAYSFMYNNQKLFKAYFLVFCNLYALRGDRSKLISMIIDSERYPQYSEFLIVLYENLVNCGLSRANACRQILQRVKERSSQFVDALVAIIMKSDWTMFADYIECFAQGEYNFRFFTLEHMSHVVLESNNDHLKNVFGKCVQLLHSDDTPLLVSSPDVIRWVNLFIQQNH